MDCAHRRNRDSPCPLTQVTRRHPRPELPAGPSGFWRFDAETAALQLRALRTCDRAGAGFNPETRSPRSTGRSRPPKTRGPNGAWNSFRWESFLGLLEITARLLPSLVIPGHSRGHETAGKAGMAICRNRPWRASPCFRKGQRWPPAPRAGLQHQCKLMKRGGHGRFSLIGPFPGSCPMVMGRSTPVAGRFERAAGRVGSGPLAQAITQA